MEKLQIDEKLLAAILALENLAKERHLNKWELGALRGLYTWRNNDLNQRGAK